VVALQGGLTRHGVRHAVGFLHHHGRRALLCLPLLFVAAFLVVPLGLTIIVSFWERAGLKFRPAFSLASYTTIVEGARLDVLMRSIIVAIETTAISLLLAYPIAYFLARKARPQATRIVLVLFTVPFLINYIVRNVAWTSLLGRNGTVNTALVESGIVGAPLDWLLYSDFAVFLGLISTYMPFMIFPLVLSIAAIDRQFLEASVDLGASAFSTFRHITLPLSLPGIFAAIVFGFVGTMGESAVPVIMGGVGYELLGNTITSSMDVLNYPLAAAISSLVVALMLMLMVGWYVAFDLKTFLGKILEWRS
jgi:ABC-type spermidine/putrescine transport system permease subunit I